MIFWKRVVEKRYAFFMLQLINITHHDSLQLSAQKKETGELSILFNYLELSSKYKQWMEICEYHLLHPDLSQHQLANHFKVSQKTIWRAYSLLNQCIM